MDSTDWIAIIGAVTGVIGMVLGIIAAVDLCNKNRVKLRVKPKLAWTRANGLALTRAKMPDSGDPLVSEPPDTIAISIVNLSVFPVTISEVGLGRPSCPDGRLIFVVPTLSTGYTWPPVLEPRREVVVYQRLDARSSNVKQLPPVAYVVTECGVVKYGRSSGLARLAAAEAG